MSLIKYKSIVDKLINLPFIGKLYKLYSLVKHSELYRHKSYYPEYASRRKPPVKIFFEQVRQILKYNSPNTYYFSYGCDVKSLKECDEYVNFRTFFSRTQYLNYIERSNCTIILRDKMIFNIFANGIGIDTPANKFYTVDGTLYDFTTKKQITIDQLKAKERNLFCKLVDGECGNGIFKLQIHQGDIFINSKLVDKEILINRLKTGRCLLQDVIKQHVKMSDLHPQSVNTIRLVTVKSLKDGVIRILPSIIRIGTGDSIVDNTSQGGLAVGIELETGRLKQYGFYKPQFGLKTEVHPDSNIRFADFIIPHFEDVKKQAIYFHSMLPGMQSIGWDIAIGENGPVFVEGNENWEINGPQICNGGLMKQYKEYFFK